MKPGKFIGVLQPLADAPVQSYMTNVLQVFDVIEWCISQMDGPVTIVQSSFSVSEEFLRRLFFYRKKGTIRSVSLVLDRKATNKTMRLWQFMHQTIEHVYLTNNHSKVILLESASDRVAIITSQNLTRGNRNESAIITTDSGVYHTMRQQLDLIMRTQSIPLHQILSHGQ